MPMSKTNHLILQLKASCLTVSLLGSVHTASEEFENAAFSLRLGVPSKLIRHGNGTFRKRSLKRGEFENAGFHFNLEGKYLETELSFRKLCSQDNPVTSLTEFSLNRDKSKMTGN